MPPLLVNVRSTNTGTLEVSKPVAVDGEPGLLVGDDGEADLPRALGIPGKTEPSLRKDSVLEVISMADDLVLVSIRADISAVEILLGNWQVVGGPLFDFHQQLSRIVGVDRPSQALRVVCYPGQGR